MGLLPGIHPLPDGEENGPVDWTINLPISINHVSQLWTCIYRANALSLVAALVDHQTSDWSAFPYPPKGSRSIPQDGSRGVNAKSCLRGRQLSVELTEIINVNSWNY